MEYILFVMHTIPFLCCLQASWCKANVPVAYFLMHTGREGLQIIERLCEKEKVTGNSFKVLESVYVPADYHDIVTHLQHQDTVTVAMLKETAMEVLMDRWFSWIILHPEMPEEKVHRSRSMFHISALVMLH